MIKLPTYEESILLTNYPDSPFYESKSIVEGYNVSVFNYRLSNWSDFNKPNAKELRGLTFVFNKDGSVYNRYVLLEKFFNLNQVPDTMYSIVKNYKIKAINNKEDGSIASFIKLPNGNIVGKSKVGFDNEQADGINRVYGSDESINKFVNWCLGNDIVPIFEYVAPHNRIVLRYDKEELILLRLRDNKTGVHIDIKEHLDKIGSIRIAPFEDDKTLDDLIELSKTEIDKEGWIVQSDEGDFKIKTQWYTERHGLLTDDIYREHIIIGFILDDKIDDVLGQIPEDEKEAHTRINKIISIIKNKLSEKEKEIIGYYDKFVKSGLSKKEYALKYRKEYAFPFVMSLAKQEEFKKMTKEEIFSIYDNISDYESAISRLEPFELAKREIRSKTSRLLIAREWLYKIDHSLNFNIGVSEDEN